MDSLRGAREWLLQCGLKEPFEITAMTGGMNNRGYKLRLENSSFFLKHYRTAERLEREFRFLERAHRAGVNGIARPLWHNPAMQLGLFEYLEGAPPEQPISIRAVEAAIRFLRQLQSIERKDLPLASDACTSRQAHWVAIQERVARSGLEKPWAARLASLQAADDFFIQPESMWVSPSDFGFHNCLRAPDGNFRFVDFEYAGLDAPCKVFCDFFAQPRIPAPLEGAPEFLDLLDPDARSRLRWMWPATILKWACIISRAFAESRIERSLQIEQLSWLAQRESEMFPFLP